MKCLMSFMLSLLTIPGNIRVIFPFLVFLFSLSVSHFAFSQGEQTPADQEEQISDKKVEGLMEWARARRREVRQTDYNYCSGRRLTLDELMEIFEQAIALQQDNDLCKLSGFKYFDSITESTDFFAADGYSGPLFVTSIIKQDGDDLVWGSMITVFRENVACLIPNRDNDGFKIDYWLQTSSVPVEDMHTKHDIYKRSATLEFDEDGRLMRALATTTNIYRYILDSKAPADHIKGERLSCLWEI